MLWEGSDFAEILQSQEGLGWADMQDEGTEQDSWFKLGIKSDDNYTAAETHKYLEQSRLTPLLEKVQ